MKCPYCKEEIKERAKKCKVCGEVLGLRGKLRIVVGLLGGLLAILVPIGTTTLAILELKAKNVAVKEKNMAVKERNVAVLTKDLVLQATQDIFDKLPKKDIEAAVKSDIKSRGISRESGFSSIETGNYSEAEEKFRRKIEINPEDETAKRGLIYLRVLPEPE